MSPNVEMQVVIRGLMIPNALEALRECCRLHSLKMSVSDKPSGTKGRPRRQIPVQKLYDAFRRTNSVRAAARELGVPPGTAWDRLYEAGLVGQRSNGKKL